MKRYKFGIRNEEKESDLRQNWYDLIPYPVALEDKEGEWIKYEEGIRLKRFNDLLMKHIVEYEELIVKIIQNHREEEEYRL